MKLQILGNMFQSRTAVKMKALQNKSFITTDPVQALAQCKNQKLAFYIAYKLILLLKQWIFSSSCWNISGELNWHSFADERKWQR